MGGKSEIEAPLRGKEFTALFRKTCAGDNGQHVALLDLLADIRRHRLDDAGQTRHHVSCAVFVEANFTRKLQARLDLSRAGDLNAYRGLRNLLCGQFNLTFLLGKLGDEGSLFARQDCGYCRIEHVGFIDTCVALEEVFDGLELQRLGLAGRTLEIARE
ncbi:hypothetical protein D3C86_1662540 [compost metagenome]